MIIFVLFFFGNQKFEACPMVLVTIYTYTIDNNCIVNHYSSTVLYLIEQTTTG
jgi:hypothetical protein